MMNKKIKKSKRPLQVKLMIAVTVIAVLVIIPLTSNIMAVSYTHLTLPTTSRV